MLKKINKAFSLIELSIVILIIGILVAGVTQSSRLVRQMKLASVRSLTQSSGVSSIQDLTLWLETTSLKSFDNENPEDNDLIAKWYDLNVQRSLKLDLSQSGADNLKPIYKSSGINGLPTLRFNGTQFITRNSVIGTEFLKDNEVTIFIVQNYNGSSATTSTISWIPKNGAVEISRFNIHALEASTLDFDFGLYGVSGQRTIVTPTNFVNKPQIIAITRNLSSVVVRTNGVTLITNNNGTKSASAVSVADLVIGRFNNNSVYGFTGDIGEIIIYARGLKDEERIEVEVYLAKKWGIKI